MNKSSQERSHTNTPAVGFDSTEHGPSVPLERQTRRAVPLPAEDLREGREVGLDNTLSETFPCSDPLSSIPNPTLHSV